jgi:hypothetical protein
MFVYKLAADRHTSVDELLSTYGSQELSGWLAYYRHRHRPSAPKSAKATSLDFRIWAAKRNAAIAEAEARTKPKVIAPKPPK